MELLGHIPTLTSIDLSGCDIHDHGLAGLRKNANIRDLSLAEIEDLTDDGLQVRQNFTSDSADTHKIIKLSFSGPIYSFKKLREPVWG